MQSLHFSCARARFVQPHRALTTSVPRHVPGPSFLLRVRRPGAAFAAVETRKASGQQVQRVAQTASLTTLLGLQSSAAHAAEVAGESAGGLSAFGADTVTSIFFTLAVVLLVVLTGGVAYLSIMDFLDRKTESDMVEDERKARLGLSGPARRVPGEPLPPAAPAAPKAKLEDAQRRAAAKGFGPKK